MEGEAKNKDPFPQLLDLIHKDKEWVMRGEDEKKRFGVSEEKKLELRLGPPGDQDWFINDTESIKTSNNNNNNNNWLVSNMNHKVMCSPWRSGSSSIPQHVKQTYLQYPSIPPNVSVVETSQTCSTKAVGELQSHQDKNACSASAAAVVASSGPAINTVNNNNNNTSQKRTAPSPVVGWPPIRSSRRNIASNSFSKPSSEQQNEIQRKEGKGKPDVCAKGLFVKINMDGVPIGRKVDLKAYDSYEKLLSAVDELFRGLLAAQRDSPVPGNQSKMAEVKEITGLLDGSGEYTLVYEDNEGDRMLVGDVPWDMFVSTVKRLRVLKRSDLSALHLGSCKQERTPVDSIVK